MHRDAIDIRHRHFRLSSILRPMPVLKPIWLVPAVGIEQLSDELLLIRLLAVVHALVERGHRAQFLV